MPHVSLPLRDMGFHRRCRVPHPSFRVLCEKRVGTLTSHAENQNPNGLTLVEYHLSQRTRKMGHAGNLNGECGQRENVGRTLLSVAVDLGFDLSLPFCARPWFQPSDQNQKRRTEPALSQVEGAGTLTSHVKNQNPNGAMLGESHANARSKREFARFLRLAVLIIRRTHV
jgi:hypothetical protein